MLQQKEELIATIFLLSMVNLLVWEVCNCYSLSTFPHILYIESINNTGRFLAYIYPGFKMPKALKNQMLMNFLWHFHPPFYKKLFFSPYFLVMFHIISCEIFGTWCFVRSCPFKHEGWGSTVIMCCDRAAGEIWTLFAVFTNSSDPHCK